MKKTLLALSVSAAVLAACSSSATPAQSLDKVFDHYEQEVLKQGGVVIKNDQLSASISADLKTIKLEVESSPSFYIVDQVAYVPTKELLTSMGPEAASVAPFVADADYLALDLADPRATSLGDLASAAQTGDLIAAVAELPAIFGNHPEFYSNVSKTSKQGVDTYVFDVDLKLTKDALKAELGAVPDALGPNDSSDASKFQIVVSDGEITAFGPEASSPVTVVSFAEVSFDPSKVKSTSLLDLLDMLTGN